MSDHDLDQRRRELFRQLLAQQGIDLTEQIPPVMETARQVPLSSMQQRVLFQQQLNPESTVYNLSAGVRITGNLDVAVLKRAVAEVVRHHAVLHTVYEADGQHERPGLQPEFTQAIATSEADLFARARELARRPFDLTKEAPVRFLLVEHDADDHVLVVVIHHVAADDASWAVLFPELFDVYRRLGVDDAAISSSTLRYSDYARWENQALSGERRAELVRQWRSVLEPTPPRLALPLDHARPDDGDADLDDEGGVVTSWVTADLRDRLHELGREESATAFMTELAVFAVLLFRHTGQRDLAIGIPALLRDRWETSQQIGNFQNTLVIRLQIDPDMSFRQLLRGVRRQCLNAYANQDLPFDQLVAELRPPRHTGRTPWIDVMFLEQKRAMAGVSCPGLEFEEIVLHNGTSQFDLTLAVCQVDGGIELTALHRTAVLDSKTVAGWLERYRHLITSVTADPEAALGILALSPPLARTPVPPSPEATTLTQRLRDAMGMHSARPAIIAGGETITYAELAERAEDLAGALRTLGAGPGSAVAVLTGDDVESLVAIAAVTLAGAAYVPIDATSPAARITELITITAPIAVWSPHTDIPAAWTGPTLGADPASWPVASDASTTAAQPTPDDPAYIIHTSGSTGAPKGVVIAHRNVTRLFDVTTQEFGFAADDRWLLAHSLAFDFSVWEVWGAWLHGGAVVVADDRRDVDVLARQIARDRISILNQTPTGFAVLAPRLAQLDIDALRWIVFGGERLDPRRFAPWLSAHPERPALMNMYGITETTVHTTWRRINAEDARDNSGSSPIGTALPDVTCDLLDAAGAPVPDGVVGEVAVAGGGLAVGYLNDPELTEQRFIGSGQDRTYLSGDLARRRTDGLEYLGRMDAQLQVRGFRIEAGEVEATIREHPSVAEAAVGSDGLALLAWVVPADGDAPAASDLSRWMSTRVPAHMVPDRWHRVEQLPLTLTGKLDRDALVSANAPVLRAGSTAKVREQAPTDATGKTVIGVWQELLGIDHVDQHENFFDLGGHSLLLAQLRDELAERIGVRLPIADLYANPTPAAQIRRLTATHDPNRGNAESQRRAAQQREALLRRRAAKTRKA